jgi:hypothetical protein
MIMVIPGWIEDALHEAVHTEAHQADMAELATCSPFGPDPTFALLTDRIRMRQLEAIELAGARYQRAYKEWRLRCAMTQDGS